MSVIRVVVVGLGWAGYNIWLPRLTAHDAYHVVAAVDPAPVARAATEEAGVVPLILSDVDEVRPGLADLAVVAVPNHLHAPLACRLLTRGCNVFVEKPVCLNLLEADQLSAAERRGGGVLLAGSAARYRADVTAFYRQVATLGVLRHIELSWVRASGVPSGAGWFTDSALAGGGALLDLGWHLLDVAMPLLGDVDFASVSGTVSSDFIGDGGRMASWRAELPGELGGDVEDTARVFLVTSDGVAVTVRASWASHEATDSTVLRVEGSAGVATLRCTFGFSPDRESGSSLTVSRDGVREQLRLPEEQIGAEYLHQLDTLPALLADRASRGAAVADVRRVIDLINRFYTSAGRREIPVATGVA